jgi:hypothetical protein
VSPILLRPIREQLEHDRVIRLLQTKWRRRYQVGINVGAEQIAPAGPANSPLYPDLVLTASEGARRVEAIVEVETAESVNNMEALAEWVPYGRLRAAFHLYVPTGAVDNARRLLADNHISVAEIWTYYQVGDQIRFTQVYKAPVKAVKPPAEKPAPARPTRRPAASRARTEPAASHRKSATPRRPAKSAAATRTSRTRPAAKKAARTTSRAQKRK